MRFTLTAEQSAFRHAVHDLLAKECSMSVVREAWEAPPGQLDRGVWNRLDEMGVTAILVPESRAGLGLDECALVPVLEETGRCALPHPIVESAMVAAPLGVSGLVATDLGGGLVSCAADADLLLLRAGPALRAYRPDEVAVTAVTTVDGARRAGTVRPLAAGTLVTDDPAEIATAGLRGTVGVAAQLVGLARRMLEITVAYVVERRQFGVPIGSFQAVKHHLANALVQIEFAAPAVSRAGHSLASRARTVARDVSMAKALAGDAAAVTGRAALQCHGAIGYTVEYDLQLLMKRAWALTRSWGDRAFHAEAVAAAITGRLDGADPASCVRAPGSPEEKR
ncbi:acyl-CoA dehydrogenase family protein [Parafrankia discariae]|uniref:acyl-CoA dehydrogenase family protein n=1 Tax=Parafrankia discariae TaxID=365528 RepID=UPI00035F826D|nr:acyl-CoA dehydrogenase family protein [Parafrankia discariae]